jgi:uncharacterized membrane protein
MIDFLFSRTPLRFFTEGIWRDEAFSYLLAKRPVAEIIALTAKDFNPPLYYVVLHYWMELFGSSQVAMRSLSLVFFTLGLFAVYETIKVIYGKTHRESLLYIALFALNPLVLFYAFEARMYTMLFFFAAAANFFFLRKRRVAYTVVTVLGLYTHYFMALVIAAHMVYILVHRTETKRTLTFFARTLAPLVVSGLLFLPWFAYFVTHNDSAGGEFWISRLKPRDLFIAPAYIYSGIDRDFWAPLRDDLRLLPLLHAFTWYLLFILTLGVTATRKRIASWNLTIFHTLGVIVPVVIVMAADIVKPLFLPRYLIFVSSAISLLTIYVISQLKGPLKWTLLILAIAFGIQFQSIQMEYRNRDGFQDVARAIEKVIMPDDLVYVRSELDYMVAQYYLGEDRVYIYGKPYEDIPSYVGKILIPQNAVRTEYPRYPRKAFVINEDKSVEVQSDYLTR